MPRLGDPSPPLLRTGNAKSVLLTLKTRADEALIITKCSPASRLRRTLPQLHTGSSPSNAGSAAYLEPLLAAKPRLSSVTFGRNQRAIHVFSWLKA